MGTEISEEKTVPINQDGVSESVPTDEAGNELKAGYDSTENQFPKEDKKALEIKDFIPEEYRDKPYLEDVDTLDQVLKKLDGAESLIGKKELEPPKEDAPPEKWDAFYERLGRPKTPEEYDISDENAELAKMLAPTFHKAGLTNKQVKQLIDEGGAVLNEAASKQQEGFSDEEFEKLSTETFGNEVDKATEVSRDLINKYADPKLKEHLNALDNKSLVLMASVLKNVHDKFIAPDSSLSAAQPESSPQSPEDLRATARKLIAKAQDPKTTIAEATMLKAKINDLYKSMGKKIK